MIYVREGMIARAKSLKMEKLHGIQNRRRRTHTRTLDPQN